MVVKTIASMIMPAPEHLCQYAERERGNHPPPVHVALQHALHRVDVKAAVHPVQYRTAQEDGQQYVEDFADMTFHFYVSECGK